MRDVKRELSALVRLTVPKQIPEGEPMQVGIFISCTTTVQLTLNDVEQAADFSDHIAKGAPDDADVSHEGPTVTVLRTFATEKAAEDWAREIREGMEKGRLFNLDISDVSDIPIQ